MIEIRPYEDLASMAVFRALDVHDHIEAELVRGASATALALFADWRLAQAHAPLSIVAVTGAIGRPFALLTLGNTGQAGVAQGAMLACDHNRHRHNLARLAVAIRRQMPAWCAERGIHRIEARVWAGHPSASLLLFAIGFAHECNMPGFGLTGTEVFRQFAWSALPSSIRPPPPPSAPLAIDPEPLEREVFNVHA